MEEIDQIIDEGGSEIIEWIQTILDYTLFNLGKTPITVSFLVFFLASILFERPIKIGDRIEVNGVYGDVVQINARPLYRDHHQ